MYESVGIVRYEFDDGKPKVVFVPDCNHFVEHDCRKMAVFVGKPGEVKAKCKCLEDGGCDLLLPTTFANATKLGDVPLAELCVLLAVVVAAAHQSKVKVQVESPEANKLELKTISHVK